MPHPTRSVSPEACRARSTPIGGSACALPRRSAGSTACWSSAAAPTAPTGVPTSSTSPTTTRRSRRSPTGPGKWSGRGHAGLVMPTGEDGTLVVEIPDWREDLVADRRRPGLARPLGWARRGAGAARAGLGQHRADRSREPAPHRRRPDPRGAPERALLMGRRPHRGDAAHQVAGRDRPHPRVDTRRLRDGRRRSWRRRCLAPPRPTACSPRCSAGCRRARSRSISPWSRAERADHFLWERMPSWNWTRPLEPGDMIHPDMYGTVNGYFYDMVRTTVAGRKATDGAARGARGRGQRGRAHHRRHASGRGLRRPVRSRRRRGSPTRASRRPAPRTPTVRRCSGRRTRRSATASASPGRTRRSSPARPRCSSRACSWRSRRRSAGPASGTGAFEHNVVVTEDGVEVLTTHAKNVWWE